MSKNINKICINLFRITTCDLVDTYPLRKLVSMDSITAHNLTFEDEVLQVLSSAKDAHPHDVDSSIMAMMCVERDTRFYADTLHAVLSQSILPGTLVIVDCASRVKQTMQTNLQVKIDSSMLTGAINTRKSLLQNANNIDSNNAIDSD